MKLGPALILTLILGLSGTAHAEATPEAAQWLQQLHDLVANQAFRMDYTIHMTGEQGGQSIVAEIKGDVMQDGPAHAINNLEMEVGSAGADGQSMVVNSRQISDGTVLWAETHLVSMGITQVGKIDLATLAEIQAAGSGLELNQSSMYMDPISQIEMLVSAFDVTVEDSAGETVRLILAPTEETVARMETEMPDGGSAAGTLVLDAVSAVPVSMEISLGTAMNIQIAFSNFETIDREDIPEGTFSYTPEAGTAVTDMAPLLKAGMH
jgi:outer membrane lipoprotein-sorting protein